MRGLDEALAGAAEAAQLAIQEAAGRTGEFSRQGLKQAADDLATLQTLFVERKTPRRLPGASSRPPSPSWPNMPAAAARPSANVPGSRSIN